MKKIWSYLIALVCVASVCVSCNKDSKEDNGENDVKAVATVSQSAAIDAFAEMYAAWQTNTVIPESVTVSGTTLTQPQYQWALCTLVGNLVSGKSSDIEVLNYKAADHPERDSYDAETIAVTGEESVATVASKILETAKEKGQIPNQTLFTRNGEAIAFSTNRATITLARTVAEYKDAGSLPKTVSTEYLSASATLKGFAEQLVTYLDVWESTVGTVSADGSHCTANGTAWKDVHFIPIPYSGGSYPDGQDQYDAKYQPYHTITVAGVEYTAAQAFVVAAKGFLDLVTKEGSATAQSERNTPVHTLANGKALNEKIPAVEEWATWGKHPWYEKSDDPCAINFSDNVPCNIAFMARALPWFLTRASQLTYIGNFVNFDSDPDKALVESPYYGNISSMRSFIILCRFYKYLLDNKINDNVYDAMKDVKLDYDLYGVVLPDIELQTKTVEFGSDASSSEATFNAKSSWTAEASDSWISVDPASGEAATPATIKISVKSNTGAAREGTVTIKGGNVTDGLVITVKQSEYVAPSEATIRDFAIEFVKCIPIWEQTIGTVESEGVHCKDKGTAWENVHFIPIGETSGNPYGTEGNQFDPKYEVWTLKVGDTEYSSAEAWEIAIRAFLNLVTKEGEDGVAAMQKRNDPFTYADGGKLSDKIPSATKGCKWGTYPWYEADNNGGALVTYNGEAISTVGVEFIVKATVHHLGRAFVKNGWNKSPLGKIGNFQQFDPDNATGAIVLDGYYGLISPMRELYVLARAYKYILDNDITENVYTALKDQQFDFDMYHQGETF